MNVLKLIHHVRDTSLYADFAPDGQRLAYSSATGLYVMNPDGTDIAQLSTSPGFGALDWIPVNQ
jgi:hypothetical protein